ncbi:MAG: hypothetical protein ACHQFW_12115, partial [Chitinophagales bacterium]
MKSYNKKLLGYSALATGFLLIKKEGDAQVVYTDPEPDIMMSVDHFGGPVYEEIYLDVNADGYDDFMFRLEDDSSSGSARISPLNSNQIAFIDETVFTVCSSSDSTTYQVNPQIFSGNLIGSSFDFTDDDIFIFNFDWYG